jgi:hypothetical protein
MKQVMMTPAAQLLDLVGAWLNVTLGRVVVIAVRHT